MQTLHTHRSPWQCHMSNYEPGLHVSFQELYIVWLNCIGLSRLLSHAIIWVWLESKSLLFLFLSVNKLKGMLQVVNRNIYLFDLFWVLIIETYLNLLTFLFSLCRNIKKVIVFNWIKHLYNLLQSYSILYHLF